MASLTPPLLAPIYLPGQEPMPAGTTPDERLQYQQMQQWTAYMNGAMESCPLKMGLSGGAGGYIFPSHITVCLYNWRHSLVGSCNLSRADFRFRSRRLLLPHVGYVRLRRPLISSITRYNRNKSADGICDERDGTEYVELRKGFRESWSYLRRSGMLYRGGESLPLLVSTRILFSHHQRSTSTLML